MFALLPQVPNPDILTCLTSQSAQVCLENIVSPGRCSRCSIQETGRLHVVWGMNDTILCKKPPGRGGRSYCY